MEAVDKKILKLDYVQRISDSISRKEKEWIQQSFRFNAVPDHPRLVYEGEVTLLTDGTGKIYMFPPSCFVGDTRRIKSSELFDFSSSPFSFAKKIDYHADMSACKICNSHEEIYKLLKKYYEWYKDNHSN